MRPILLLVLMICAVGVKAQTFMPGNFMGSTYGRSLYRNSYLLDSSRSEKKWSLTPYGFISSDFYLFRGGNISLVSVPVGLQLNRRLSNNLYAFAGVSAAPAYVNFGRSFLSGDFNKMNQNGTFYKPANLGMYSRAELGLQYINDEKTFSISGSIGIERSSYPAMLYGPMNNTRANQIVSPNR